MMKSTAPRLGWMTDPHAPGVAGTAHATYPGKNAAICGVPTPFLGEAWPLAGHDWIFAFRRCPSCAQRLYGPDRH